MLGSVEEKKKKKKLVSQRIPPPPPPPAALKKKKAQGGGGGNKPKVSPQINNLPSTQPNQHAHSPKRKPLDALIRALVGIPQLLLARTQILHLVDDFGDHLLDAAQFGFHGLELFLGLDARPVAGVGADVDVEFDRAGGVGDGIFFLN